MLPARVENAKWRTTARGVFPAILVGFSSRTRARPRLWQANGGEDGHVAEMWGLAHSTVREHNIPASETLRHYVPNHGGLSS
jgi:hypothetical protein